MPRKPISLRSGYADNQASEFGKAAAKKFKSGKYTASQTGAADLAVRRNTLDAATYQSDKKVMRKGIKVTTGR